MDKKCPFCSPGINCHVFMETSGMLAVYNIAPILPGHAMVIPRRHIESVFEMNTEELAELVLFSRKVTHLLMKAFNAVGFDWSLQESEAAGQSIAHLHLHIIPRKPKDLKRPGEWYSLLQGRKEEIIDSASRKKLNTEEIQSIVASLKKITTNHAF